MKTESETIRERPDLENVFDVATCTNFLRYEWTARFLYKNLLKNAKILEVGIGFGWGTKKRKRGRFYLLTRSKEKDKILF